MEDFGLFLGASYEGYEDRVMKLLCYIEASLGFRNNGGVDQQSREVRPWVARELKNLISNINYDGEISSQCTSNRGWGFIIVPMNSTGISWNVGGLNDGAKRLSVRNLLSRWKPDIVCF